jgi:hypothetical protein
VSSAIRNITPTTPLPGTENTWVNFNNEKVTYSLGSSTHTFPLGHFRPLSPPHLRPSRLTQKPGQSARISQFGFEGSLMQVWE